MSIEPSENAHDPAQSSPENGDVEESNRRPDADDELVVVVCPHRIYDRLRPELDESRDRLCRKYEREYEDLLAERAQLADEVEALERRLRRKEAQLDAIVTRNEQILDARTESYRRRIEEGGKDEGDDDFEWTGRRKESGLLARLKNWLR